MNKQLENIKNKRAKPKKKLDCKTYRKTKL